MQNHEAQIQQYEQHTADLEARRQAALDAAAELEREQPVEALAKRGEANKLKRELSEAAEAVRPAYEAKARAQLAEMEPRFQDLDKRMQALRAEWCETISRFLTFDPALRALVDEHAALVRQHNARANVVGADHRQPMRFAVAIRPVAAHIRSVTNRGLRLTVKTR